MGLAGPDSGSTQRAVDLHGGRPSSARQRGDRRDDTDPVNDLGSRHRMASPLLNGLLLAVFSYWCSEMSFFGSNT